MLHNYRFSRKGFTLAELLTAVIIVTVLVAMATPLYEKLVERSHLAEVRQVLNSLQQAKLFAMDKMDIENYDTSNPKPTMDHLNVSFGEATSPTGESPLGATSFSTKHFTYSLKPGSGNLNGVCAVRLKGDAAGTVFYYYHPSGRTDTHIFQCSNSNPDLCEKAYGLENTPGVSCNI